MKYFLLFISFSFLVYSCGSDTQAESADTSEDTEMNIDTTFQDEVLVFDKNDYANDWIVIRNAILSSDTTTLDRFIMTADTDAESVIGMCQEDWVRNELTNLPYENLPEVDFNGDLVKEFSAEITEKGEDGEEYGSAIMFYFKETKEGLRLTSLMAAG